MPSTTSERDATIADLLRFIWPESSDAPLIPWWPPDVFAVTATLLRRTGGYVRVLQLRSKQRTDCIAPEWPKQAKVLAEIWRRQLNVLIEKNPKMFRDFLLGGQLAQAQPVAPGEVIAWWNTLLQAKAQSIATIDRTQNELTMKLVKLCCVADEASRNIGICSELGDASMVFADAILARYECRTVCVAVPRDRYAVLPKQHTPQRGLTVRSLSHHLSLHPATEVMPKWRPSVKGEELEIINLLLLPWPTDTVANDFRVLSSADELAPSLPDSYRFFAYEPRNPWGNVGLQERLRLAFEQAEQHAARVHAIVFPELALTLDEFKNAERFALNKRSLLMAGVRAKEGEFGRELQHNAWAFQTRGLDPTAGIAVDADLEVSRISQAKHHRWCLDRNQILQYCLGGRLPASKDCWELTDIQSREVEFFTMDNWLTWTVLICEDLARQDPVAEVIRAIGPNMVVALLMDGPQLKERWPSRYAAVLAEDPGCSVLTLTSLGMSRRTLRPNRNHDRSNVIALWRDVCFGVQEIELPPGHDACVLSLVSKSTVEYTADGRGDNGRAFSPVFAGVHSFDTLAH